MYLHIISVLMINLSNPWTLALIVLLVYWLAVALLDRAGTLEKYNISNVGPILMIRTKKGQRFLDRISAPRAFWRLFASVGIPLMVVSMVAMFSLLLFSDYLMISQPPRPSPYTEIQNVVILPGINRFIPLWWGIIGLASAIIAHEFSHAILGKVEEITVKSLGILMMIIPIGAFAELDEEQLLGVKKDAEEEKTESEKREYESGAAPWQDRLHNAYSKNHQETKEILTEPKKVASSDQRVRVFASGVMGNFAVAFIAFTLFFSLVLNGISPAGNDVVVLDVVKNSYAEKAGLHKDMIITHFDDARITNISQYNSYLNVLKPGSEVRVRTFYDNKENVFLLKKYDESGVLIVDVIDGYPAKNAGLTAGMKIVKLDGTPVNSTLEFLGYMNKTKPGDLINVLVMDGDKEKDFQIELASAPHQSKGFMGVRVDSSQLGMAAGEFPSQIYLDAIRSFPSKLDQPGAWLWLLAAPFLDILQFGFSGFDGMLLQFYQPAGWASGLGIGIFWIANILFWIGWINITVGMFNCLPAVPLDGGHVFREIASSFVGRLTKDETKREKVAGAIVTALALLIFSSFLFLVFGPYIVEGFIRAL